jgi:membrane-associated protein
VLWVASCFGLGYVFGNIEIVKQNFSLVAIIIIVVSVLPVVWELVKARRMRTAGGPAK